MGAYIPAQFSKWRNISWDRDGLQLHYTRIEQPRLHIHGMCGGAHFSRSSSSRRLELMAAILCKAQMDPEPNIKYWYDILQAFSCT